MSNVSTVFIVSDANKAALEAFGSDKAFDCIASRMVRGAGMTTTEPTHWLGHAYCTDDECKVLEAAEDLNLLSVDADELATSPLDHATNILTTFGLEFIPSDDT